jgi:hypothetical protein
MERRGGIYIKVVDNYLGLPQDPSENMITLTQQLRRRIAQLFGVDDKLLNDLKLNEIMCCNNNCIHRTDIFMEEARGDKYYKCKLKMMSPTVRGVGMCKYREDLYKTEW